MDRLNLVSFIFLVVLFVLTPRAALRSARTLRQVEADGQAIPRRRMTLSTMFALAVLWAISSVNATMMGENLFSVRGVGLREVGIGVAGFALLLLAIPVARALRSPEEDRRRLMRSMAPRTSRELAIFALVAVMAGVAEESAYRGVAVWILAPILGHLLPAMFLSAMAFAVAHAVQGGKTMAMVFIIAAVFHAIVYFTGTLVIAMVVHAAYDIIAGHVAGKRARAMDAADAAPADATTAKTASPAPPTAPGRTAG
ncbi:MAG TPA: CPBP family intramembrane glutamic endopeptidase [Gemmatimonadaceae bacterium]|nr:CPBP family intramembrane glutamic endopeptidase [Gemmatimonadaceae bacterium]